MQKILSAMRGDITSLSVDVLVNAANSSLLGGGGVDGAIHRAAGPELLAACRELHGCKVGDAKITPGYRLKARFVVHTVGPIWSGGEQDEANLLASCYRRSLEVAAAAKVQSMAFPCISTGVYGYPKPAAARVAFDAVNGYLSQSGGFQSVIFCCFGADDLGLYQKLLAQES
jgi:O-acetyl-ADP-ribose deacetylase (regulator of RNase III)